MLIGAGTPLAFAWARLLPEDAPPFPIEPGSFPSVDHEAPQEEPNRKKDHFIAAPLLFCPNDRVYFSRSGISKRHRARVGWLEQFQELPQPGARLQFRCSIALIGIGAIVFGALRPGPLRIPLIAAGALTLVLVVSGATASDRDVERYLAS